MKLIPRGLTCGILWQVREFGKCSKRLSMTKTLREKCPNMELFGHYSRSESNLKKGCVVKNFLEVSGVSDDNFNRGQLYI